MHDKDQAARRGSPVADVREAEALLEDIQRTPKIDKTPGRKSLEKKVADWGAAEALRAIGGVVCAISTTMEGSALIREIMNAAIRSLDAERGVLFLGGGEDAVLVPVMALDVRGEELSNLEHISRSVLRRVRDGEVIVCEDVAGDARFRDVPSLELSQIRSILCAPLIARGKPIGVIYLDTRAAGWGVPQNTTEFMAVFARIAATALENSRLHSELVQEAGRLRRSLDSKEPFRRLVAVSASMGQLLRRAEMAAQVDTPILLLGESGTGKELLARAIHEAGPRAAQSFVVQNCAAVPNQLMESIFFGHCKGAFTGAMCDSVGLLREADRGVLFLDEIADLDFSLQAKLLRVLEDGMVRPLGGRKDFRVEVNLISATSRDLRQEMSQRRFREELYHRINVLELRIPSLRERPEDIPLLVDHFLRRHSPLQRGRPPIVFTPRAIEFLKTRPWPGNVRELENLIRRVIVLSDRRKVDAPHIEPLFALSRADEKAPLEPMAETREITPFVIHERRILRDALIRTGGNKSKSARLLRWTRGKFLRRMAALGLDQEEF